MTSAFEPWRFINFGIEGPKRSASSNPTFFSSCESAKAKLTISKKKKNSWTKVINPNVNVNKN